MVGCEHIIVCKARLALYIRGEEKERSKHTNWSHKPAFLFPPRLVPLPCLGPGMHATSEPPSPPPHLPIQAPPTRANLPSGGGLSNPGFVHSFQGGRGGFWAEAKQVLEVGGGSFGKGILGPDT